MKIESMGFNLYVPKITSIMQVAAEIERELGDCFLTPFTTVSIPSDAPEEIPRMIARSHNGHSELTVSLINVSLNVNFDDIFNKDIEKCFEYMNNRIDKLVEIFSKYSEGKFIFSGITSRIILDKINTPMEFLSKNFVNVKSIIKPYNMSEKITYLIEDKYFLNFNVYNLRTFEGLMHENSVKPEVKEVSHYIAIDIDINDKYGYNHNDEHISTKETIKYIIEKMKYNIDKNVNNILEGRNLEL